MFKTAIRRIVDVVFGRKSVVSVSLLNVGNRVTIMTDSGNEYSFMVAKPDTSRVVWIEGDGTVRAGFVAGGVIRSGQPCRVIRARGQIWQTSPVKTIKINRVRKGEKT